MIKLPENTRILHCAESIKGGVATYLRELLPMQCGSFGAANIWLLIPVSQKGELPVPEGVQLMTFPDGSWRLIKSLYLALYALCISIKNNINIVHLHSTYAGAFVRPLLACFCRAKLVYCAHGWAWEREISLYAKAAIRLFEKTLAKITDRIICISEHEKKTALAAGISDYKLVVVKNAISSCAPPAEAISVTWPECKMKLLFVGRLDRQKGVDILLDALKYLGNQVHVLIVGEPVLNDVKEMAVPPNATKIGWLTPGQLQTLFKRADVLIVPSRWEGFGLIALEAMRAGLPVIASNVGGLPEIIEHGVTGLIIPQGDSMALALAQVVQELDALSLRKMGEAGKIRMEECFSIPRLHQQMTEVYKSII